jgi:hypothetical protein
MIIILWFGRKKVCLTCFCCDQTLNLDLPQRNKMRTKGQSLRLVPVFC